MFCKYFARSRMPLMKNCQWQRRDSTSFQALRFSKFGQPMDVLKLCEGCLDRPTGSQVLVKILASPINPSDVNTIQGKYPVKPNKFPATAGNECVATVCAVGDQVKGLKIGDRVIFVEPNLGSWSTFALIREENLARICRDIEIALAATLTVNPPTAYRMLKDIVPLESGDTVIQNGGASAVGQYVTQLCKAWGLKCISVLRSGPRFEQNKKLLFDLGASEVLKEEETANTKLFKEGKYKKPKLALNCIGGQSSIDIARHLADAGTMVTYGGMSMKPVSIATSNFIFKDQKFIGYWIVRWFKKHKNSSEQQKMFDDLYKLIKEGKLKPPPYQFIRLEDYKDAEAALNLQSFGGKKAILVMCH